MALVTTAVPLRSDATNLSAVAQSVITLDNVTKTFQTHHATVRALDTIQLSIREKEFVCLIGPSGCGKSTILGLIAGLAKPTSGTLRIDGKSIDVARQGHQIGLVFQDPVLLPWRTVHENVSLPLEVLKFPRSERLERIKVVLELVGLSGFEQRFPHELSGGMRQRLGIARALSFDPQVLLMDEPFGALDTITRDKMSIELLRIWEQQQKTVVFVTHSISEAALLSDRVVVLTPRPGRISAIIDNPLARPRPLQMRDCSEFIALSRQLRQLLEVE
jgi:NitT/TauT family transport system ATP-binding protein